MVNEYTLTDLRRVMEKLWPSHTAEPWDQVGLVTGHDDQPINKILLAVDPVRATVNEAVNWGADALVTHHPLLLRGVHSLAENTSKGALAADLIRAEIALLTAHTNADAPEDGVSDLLAQRFGLTETAPIAVGETPDVGIGRVGRLRAPVTLRAFAELVAQTLPNTATGIRVAGAPERIVERVALCGGAGDSFLAHPLVTGADVYVTSDLRHHPAQDSQEQALTSGGPALIDVSHWASESLWLTTARDQLRDALPGTDVRVSSINTDPWTFRV